MLLKRKKSFTSILTIGLNDVPWFILNKSSSAASRVILWRLWILAYWAHGRVKSPADLWFGWVWVWQCRRWHLCERGIDWVNPFVFANQNPNYLFLWLFREEIPMLHGHGHGHGHDTDTDTRIQQFLKNKDTTRRGHGG